MYRRISLSLTSARRHSALGKASRGAFDSAGFAQAVCRRLDRCERVQPLHVRRVSVFSASASAIYSPSTHKLSLQISDNNIQRAALEYQSLTRRTAQLAGGLHRGAAATFRPDRPGAGTSACVLWRVCAHAVPIVFVGSSFGVSGGG